MVLGTKKAAHIGGASGHHGPKLHELVAVQIIEVQQVSFFVRVGAVHFVHRVYDTDDNYIIYGVSNYLKGNLQLSYLKEGESILVISNGKVLLSDPYQFDKIYSIQLLQ